MLLCRRPCLNALSLISMMVLICFHLGTRCCEVVPKKRLSEMTVCCDFMVELVFPVLIVRGR